MASTTPTNLPWGVEYVNANTLGQPGLVVHPEVAYEMILTLVLLGALLPFHQRLKARLPDGVLGLVYLGLYGLGRFFLSYLRTDPAVYAGLRQAQIASLVMFVGAVVLIPILMRRQTTTLRHELAERPVVAPLETPSQELVATPPLDVEPERVPEPETGASHAITSDLEPSTPVESTAPDPPAPMRPGSARAPRGPRTKTPPKSPEPPEELPG
jgi:hypothetical protein